MFFFNPIVGIFIAAVVGLDTSYLGAPASAGQSRGTKMHISLLNNAESR
jgi:gas vesicle protein